MGTEEDAEQESLGSVVAGLSGPPPFRFRPAMHWSPIVLSFPHVGLRWPPELEPQPEVEFGRNADYEVQTLYDRVQELGVATIEAAYSRLVVDLNRAEDDVCQELVPDHPNPRPRRRPGVLADGSELHGHRWDRPGRGVMWASAIGRGPEPVPILERPVSYAAFLQRIERYHRPYYEAVDLLLRRRHQRFGYAILIDAHSMPGSIGVDLVIGTLDGASCSGRLRQFALSSLSASGLRGGPLLSVRVDNPYRGGEIIRRFGLPEKGFHAFQLEIGRHLYMDEERNLLLDPQPYRGSASNRRPPTALAELRTRLQHLVRSIVERRAELDLGRSAETGFGSAAE